MKLYRGYPPVKNKEFALTLTVSEWNTIIQEIKTEEIINKLQEQLKLAGTHPLVIEWLPLL